MIDWNARLTKVARFYTKHKGDTAKVQNHFPSVSRRSIQRWVRRAKAQGYL